MLKIFSVLLLIAFAFFFYTLCFWICWNDGVVFAFDGLNKISLESSAYVVGMLLLLRAIFVGYQKKSVCE